MPQTKTKPAAEPTEPKHEVPKLPDWMETPGDTNYRMIMFGSGGEFSQQEIELTRLEYISLKDRLYDLRGPYEPGPEPKAPSLRQDASEQRVLTTVESNIRRSEFYEAEVSQLKLPARFASANWEPRDLIRILALADLLAYHGHSDYACTDDLPNWLGILLADILDDLISLGPEALNADPRLMKRSFDCAMFELRDALSLFNRVQSKLPSVLEKIDSWAPRKNPQP